MIQTSCSGQPVRITGIKEDYSSWVDLKIKEQMFKGMSLEIVSVSVDYDDDNRITFELLNGETVIQPKPDRAGVVVDNEEIRVWNITKAHWCLWTLSLLFLVSSRLEKLQMEAI